MPSRRPERPTRIEILRQAVIDDEPLDEGALVPEGRPGPPRAPWSLTGAPWSLQGAMVPVRAPWSLQGAMVPDRAPWSPSGRHGPQSGPGEGLQGEHIVCDNLHLRFR
ncbi:hypothetical protein SUGI_0442120 [Cryptomeria japonica]|nr:hypothetical protein SUGI_0442120 [Cryptomeria japonica]